MLGKADSKFSTHWAPQQRWGRSSTLPAPEHWLISTLALLHSKKGLASQRSGQYIEIHLCEVVFSLPFTALPKEPAFEKIQQNICLWEPTQMSPGPENWAVLTTERASCHRALQGASLKCPHAATTNWKWNLHVFGCDWWDSSRQSREGQFCLSTDFLFVFSGNKDRSQIYPASQRSKLKHFT